MERIRRRRGATVGQSWRNIGACSLPAVKNAAVRGNPRSVFTMACLNFQGIRWECAR